MMFEALVQMIVDSKYGPALARRDPVGEVCSVYGGRHGVGPNEVALLVESLLSRPS